MKPLLSLESPRLDYLGVSLSNPYQAKIPEGITVVIGPNGAGKSTLARIIARGRNLSLNKIRTYPDKFSATIITFSDVHSLGNNKVTYHQQRYESSMNDEVPTVREFLGEKGDTPQWENVCRALMVDDILDKKINYLSSGETRKLLIAIALLNERADLLIIDNPFIGLDKASREAFGEMLGKLKDDGQSIMLLVSDPAEIPPSADFVLPVVNLTILKPLEIDGHLDAVKKSLGELFDFKIDPSLIPLSENRESSDESSTLVSLKNCRVKYGSRTLIDNITWTIKKGEKWVLEGANGSGKSTLLSLIHADNPQAYSNDVELFGRRRGTGESIWDVKKRIGYISSEMHLYFGGGSDTVRDVIARGLNDTVGSYTKLTEHHYQTARLWIDLFSLQSIAERRFNTLSDGEQRLVLLIRAFVKNPELIILDEPMHGLDLARKNAVRQLINKMALKRRATFIFVTHSKDEIPDNFNRILRL